VLLFDGVIIAQAICQNQEVISEDA